MNINYDRAPHRGRQPRGAWRRPLAVGLAVGLAGAFLGLLVGPAAAEESTPARDIVVLVDNSGSMKSNDPQFQAGQAVGRFVQRLDTTDRVSLFLFDQTVRMLVPLTAVGEAGPEPIVQTLASIDYRGQRTDSPAAVERAIYELKNNARPDSVWSIVFLTDGIVDVGDTARDAELSRWLREDLATEAADLGIRIYSVAFTRNADFLLAQSLARRTQGEYFRVFEPQDIDGALEQIETLARTDARDELVPPPEPAQAAAPEQPPVPVAAEPVIALTPPVAGSPGALGAADTNQPIPISVLRLPRAVPEVLDEPAQSDAFAGLDIMLISGGAAVVCLAVLVVWRRRRGTVEANAPVAVPQAITARPAPVAEAGPRGLLAARAEHAGEPLVLGDRPVMVGRVRGDGSDGLEYLVIPRKTIGRRHALLEFRNHSFWVEDQRSVNGTYVNDERIEAPTRLKHGDLIRFHDAEYEFRVPEVEDFENTCLATPQGPATLGQAAAAGAPGGSWSIRFDGSDEDPGDDAGATRVRRFDDPAANAAGTEPSRPAAFTDTTELDQFLTDEPDTPDSETAAGGDVAAAVQTSEPVEAEPGQTEADRFNPDRESTAIYEPTVQTDRAARFGVEPDRIVSDGESTAIYHATNPGELSAQFESESTDAFEVSTQVMADPVETGAEGTSFGRTDAFDMQVELASVSVTESDDEGDLERLMRQIAQRQEREDTTEH